MSIEHREVIDAALQHAARLGATYADVRIVRMQDEVIEAREDHVSRIRRGDSFGFGLRVLKGGAWGFAASARVSAKEAERVAVAAVSIAEANAALRRAPVELAPTAPVRATYRTSLETDARSISLAEKTEFLLTINTEALHVPRAKYALSWLHSIVEEKVFASSDGSLIEQEILRIRPGYTVTAVDPQSGRFESRDHDLPPMQAGWEYVTQTSLVSDARRIAEQAVEKLGAPSVKPGVRDLILDPSNLWLTIHESIGHPTELDRALGYEANFAGTSFLTKDLLGRFQLGSESITLYADKTTPGGLATCGYDDDGVATQKWDLVRRGKFVAYQTTREQAGWIGEAASRGCSYAQGFESFPFQRMPNISLAPSEKETSLEEIVADTEDGIYLVGRGSFSIDHQRYNFQFGGQMFYEVRGGRIRNALRDVAYQANTPDFWRACDLVGGPASWQLHGSMVDGKGEPSQSNPVSHGCPPARFRRVNILNTSRTKAA